MLDVPMLMPLVGNVVTREGHGRGREVQPVGDVLGRARHESRERLVELLEIGALRKTTELDELDRIRNLHTKRARTFEDEAGHTPVSERFHEADRSGRQRPRRGVACEGQPSGRHWNRRPESTLRHPSVVVDGCRDDRRSEQSDRQCEVSKHRRIISRRPARPARCRHRAPPNMRAYGPRHSSSPV